MDKDVNAHRCSYIEREKPILLDSNDDTFTQRL